MTIEKKQTTVRYTAMELPITIPMQGQADLLVGVDLFGNVQFKSADVKLQLPPDLLIDLALSAKNAVKEAKK